MARSIYDVVADLPVEPLFACNEGDVRMLLRLDEVVGKGGFATVWRAFFRDRICACKVLLPRGGVFPPAAIVRLFIRECSTLMNMDHSAVIRCLGLLKLRKVDFPELALPYDTYGMLLEFCEGGTLKDLLMAQLMQMKDQYTVREALGWLAQVASALQQFHSLEYPIIHRDIKPENVLLQPLAEDNPAFPPNPSSMGHGRRQQGRSGGGPRTAFEAKLADLGLGVRVGTDRSVLVRRRTTPMSLASGCVSGSLNAAAAALLVDDELDGLLHPAIQGSKGSGGSADGSGKPLPLPFMGFTTVPIAPSKRFGSGRKSVSGTGVGPSASPSTSASGTPPADGVYKASLINSLRRRLSGRTSGGSAISKSNPDSGFAAVAIAAAAAADKESAAASGPQLVSPLTSAAEESGRCSAGGNGTTPLINGTTPLIRPNAPSPPHPPPPLSPIDERTSSVATSLTLTTAGSDGLSSETTPTTGAAVSSGTGTPGVGPPTVPRNPLYTIQEPEDPSAMLAPSTSAPVPSTPKVATSASPQPSASPPSPPRPSGPDGPSLDTACSAPQRQQGGMLSTFQNLLGGTQGHHSKSSSPQPGASLPTASVASSPAAAATRTEGTQPQESAAGAAADAAAAEGCSPGTTGSVAKRSEPGDISRIHVDLDPTDQENAGSPKASGFRRQARPLNHTPSLLSRATGSHRQGETAGLSNLVGAGVGSALSNLLGRTGTGHRASRQERQERESQPHAEASTSMRLSTTASKETGSFAQPGGVRHTLRELTHVDSLSRGMRRMGSLLRSLNKPTLPKFRPDSEYQWVYALTGQAGSCMYMAPEVFQGEPYNEKVDVYSFGVMMFELLARELLVVKYMGGTKQGLELGIKDPPGYVRKVCDGFRPPRSPRIPESMWQLIQLCWHADPLVRPDMTNVRMRLEAAVQEWDWQHPPHPPTALRSSAGTPGAASNIRGAASAPSGVVRGLSEAEVTPRPRLRSGRKTSNGCGCIGCF